jgi:cytoskeleton protein RodZ
MSDLNLAGQPVDRTEVAQGAGMTAGLILRNAREAAGLHVAALAVSMKIPVKKLEALENDKLDLLHDAVFIRALAASVCRTLKIDPAPVLAKLPSNTVPRLKSDERGINAPFNSRGNNDGLSISTLLAKPQILIVFALLAGAVAVFFLPERQSNETSSGQSLQLQKMSDKSESLSNEKPAAMSVESEAALSPQPISISENGGAVANSSQEPRQATASVSSSEVNRVSLGASGNAPGMILFKAKAASWVKVVDSNGVVQLSKTLTDGETISASGTVPLSVVIGRADAVEVEVRGKAFSLAAVAKENVARFEVK